MSKHSKIGIIGYPYLGSSLYSELQGADIVVSRVYNPSAQRIMTS